MISDSAVKGKKKKKKAAALKAAKFLMLASKAKALRVKAAVKKCKASLILKKSVIKKPLS